MSIHIHSTKDEEFLTKTNVKVQSVPFKIYADCDAKVTHCFDSLVKVDEDKNLTTSFRGRRLNGKKLELPKGYVGLVLHESIKPLTDKEDRKLYVIHRFDSLIYWNWDKKVSRNDKIIQALDWIDIAEALHSPIVEE